MEFSGDFGGDLFSPALAQILCGAYGSLMPMHDFLAEVWEAAREEERE